MKHSISQVDGNNYSEDEITEEIIHVTLKLDGMGDIVGPQLPPSALPPDKVFHPKAGIGIVEEEQSITPDGDTYINYFFSDDQKKTFLHKVPTGESG